MDEFIKLLDENLDYLEHKIMDDTIIIFVASNRKEVACPYCGEKSFRVHSTYDRSFQDLPIQGKKVKVVIDNRKMFCDNRECSHTTFAETFDFLPPKAKKSQRLTDEIINISLNVSSITASNLLKNGIADVGKSTICNLLKKRYTKH